MLIKFDNEETKETIERLSKMSEEGQKTVEIDIDELIGILLEYKWAESYH